MNVADILADELIVKAKFYTTANDHLVSLKDGFLKGKTPGETTHLKSLDDILRIRMGFLYCFTGWPGSGKSEFLTQLAVMQAHFENRKIGFYSPESYPVDEFIDTIAHCYMGKSTDKRWPNVCSESEYMKAIEWIDKYFFFCDAEETPEVDQVIQWWDYLNKTKGAKIFIADPYNSLNDEAQGGNMALNLKLNLTKFKRFATQKKVCVILIEHPKTPADNGEYDKIPTNRNLFGGSMWWNKVDVGVSVHRPNREDIHDNSVIIKSWKVKKQELNGRPGERVIHFNIRTKRYYEMVHCIDHSMDQIKTRSFYEIDRSETPF